MLPLANQFSEINYLCLKFQAPFLFSCPDRHGIALAVKLTAVINFPGVLFADVELGDATEKHSGTGTGARGTLESTEKVPRSVCFLIFPYQNRVMENLLPAS